MPSGSALFVVAVLATGVPQSGPASVSAPIAIDVVTMPSGIVLGPQEVSVSVDGRPRKIISVRPVLRGPGSERLAAEAAPSAGWPIAEPIRTVIVAVDQNSLSRGSEKKFSAMIARLLDLLAPADRAALIGLPFERSGSIAVTRDRRVLWSALGRIRVGSASAPLVLAGPEQPPPLADDEPREVRSPSSEEGVTNETNQRERQPGLPRGIQPAENVAERRAGPLDDLRGLLSTLREIPGAKTILLVRGTAAAESDTREEVAAARLESAGLLQQAAESRATLHTVTLGDRWRGAADEATRLARMTGGDEFRLDKQADRELERLGAWISEGLRIAIEGAPDDLDARSHQVAIATNRRGVTVRGPERWLPFEAREPTRAVGAQPTIASASGGARSAAGPGAATSATDAQLQRVLARMSSYVAQYVEDFSAVVAEETYEQHVTQVGRWAARKMRSDFLLVRVPGQDEWTPFRDVFEVNGTSVRDRDDRLRKLFIEMPPDALDKARRILDEGARYNIGSIYHNVNLPVLPLMFLIPKNIGGLQFRRAGEEGIEGVHAWRIDFEETGRPTLIKNDRERRDIPSTGSLWVDPMTGRILKTRIRIVDRLLRMDTSVVYRRSDTLHLWAPSEMEEMYVSGAERLTGSARYRNFRRFRVDVEEKIAVPKN